MTVWFLQKLNEDDQKLNLHTLHHRLPCRQFVVFLCGFAV
jgi:hypothetical protein